MAVDEFSRSVQAGLQLSKRISYGKDKASMTVPKAPSMKKSLSACSSSSSLRFQESYRPTAPMVYAVIIDPSIVDNPDICSYQPYVYGHCDPPALVPLHMHGIAMEVDCYLDTAFVTVTGNWRLHCVTSASSCDCRIAIPMGDQGSVLGIEVESSRRSYSTQLITPQNEKDAEKSTMTNNGFLMKGNTYMFKISQVEGGSYVNVTIKWSQKLLYQDHQFCLNVPFTFPDHVLPVVKSSNKERIMLNVKSGTDTNIISNYSSHPLKETKRQNGELGFSYEANVKKWSTEDFYFTFSMSTEDIIAGLLLQTPSLHDYDQRNMFCFYLFRGSNKVSKPFRKEVVFLIDISASMQDEPLEKTKDAVINSLLDLTQEDSFNIIAFSENIQSYSSSLESASEDGITNAIEWMHNTLIPEGGTNLLLPLKQALDMVGKSKSTSIPLIFLITDGAVEDEKDICNIIKDHVTDGGIKSPRIFTFGIGSYCNHYFLQMLAQMGRGCYDAAFDVDSISNRLPQLLNNALYPVLANVSIDGLESLDSLQLYPFRIPDLYGSPLIVSGRYHGNFPDIIKARGFISDLSVYEIEVKVRKSKGIPLDKVCAKREIDTLTARAWLHQNKQLEEKVANISLKLGFPSEYTHTILLQGDKVKAAIDSITPQEKYSKLENHKVTLLTNLSVGFGNLTATVDNLPPGIEDVKLNEPTGIMMKAASSCYGVVLDRCCCMGLLRACSQMNDQCAVALTQLCTALACCECLNCCCEICDSCGDLC